MTIYFIQAGLDGEIKIGFTAGAPESRMAHFQTGHYEELRLLGTIPGIVTDERAIHRELKAYHVHGEWFRSAPELVALIAEIVRDQLSWVHFRKIREIPSYEEMESEWFQAFNVQVDQTAYDDIQASDVINRMLAWVHRADKAMVAVITQLRASNRVLKARLSQHA